ncbi:hypothetical protein GCM10020000_31770 [Streptomyces olivoverticillatus]
MKPYSSGSTSTSKYSSPLRRSSSRRRRTVDSDQPVAAASSAAAARPSLASTGSSSRSAAVSRAARPGPAGRARAAACSGSSPVKRPGQPDSPATIRSRHWAVTAVIREVRGSFGSSRLPRTGPACARMTQVISVPPLARPTHEVSSRSTSAAATAGAASGVHRIRTNQSAIPILRASGSPTTRSTPADLSR